MGYCIKNRRKAYFFDNVLKEILEIEKKNESNEMIAFEVRSVSKKQYIKQKALRMVLGTLSYKYRILTGADLEPEIKLKKTQKIFKI